MNNHRMERCAAAVHKKGAPLTGCWGFIDGTVRLVSRPIVGQEGIYNGHHHTHALKYQAVAMANGMIVSLAGPFVGHDHNMRILAESNLDGNLQAIGNGQATNMPINSVYIFGDMGYVISNKIIVPFEGLNLSASQKRFNLEMSRVRECVEWSYKDVLQYFGFMRDKYNLRTGVSPVGLYYSVACIMTNCHNIFYPNQTSQYFDIAPGTIDEYIKE